MRLKLGLALGIFALATLWIVPSAAAQRGDPEWVWVCHNGKVLLVSTSSSHVAHLDPSEPHVSGFGPSPAFTAACEGQP